MRKKILLLVLVLLVFTVASTFATGIGIQGGLDFMDTPYASNLALSFKLDEFPMMFGLGWNFAGGVAIGASADWWVYHDVLTGIISLYAGPGIFGGFSTGGSGSFWLGPRVAFGFQIFPIEPLEIFLELDPSLALLPAPDFVFQGSIGARFWF